MQAEQAPVTMPPLAQELRELRRKELKLDCDDGPISRARDAANSRAYLAYQSRGEAVANASGDPA